MDDNMLQVAAAISKGSKSSNHAVPALLQKIFKRCSEDINKLNAHRLARLNSLLQQFTQDIRKVTAEDIDAVTRVIGCLLKIVNISDIDDQRLQILMSIWKYIGGLLTLLPEYQAVGKALQLLQFLLVGKNFQVGTLSELSVLLPKCQYLNELNLKMEDDDQHKFFSYEATSQEQYDVVILKNCDLLRLFGSLLSQSDSQTLICELCIASVKIASISNKAQFYIRLFDRPDTDIKCLKTVLAKGQLDVRGKDKIEKLIEKLMLSQDLPGKTADLKMAKICSEQSDLVKLFQKSTEQSYYVLQKLIKSGQMISKDKFKEILNMEEVNNRQAIIVSLMVAQQRQNMLRDIIKIYGLLSSPTEQQKHITILMLHLSQQVEPNICQVFTGIMSKIPASELNNKSNFDFVPLQPVSKVKLQRSEKSIVAQLIKEDAQQSEQIIRAKIDLSTAFGVGEPSSLLNSIDAVMKHINLKPQQIVESLHSITDDSVLELVLMKVNSSFESKHFEPMSMKIVDWACKMHGKQYEKYKKHLKEYLQSQHQEGFLNLILAVRSWNLTTSEDSLSIPQFSQLMVPSKIVKITSESYSSYFIHVKSKQLLLDLCLRDDIRLRELESFLGFCYEKHQGKSELKKLVEQNNYKYVYLLQALKAYFDSLITKPDFLRELLKRLPLDADTYEQTEKKAEQLSIECPQIQQYFQFMLGQIYEDALSFMCRLIKSKSPKEEKVNKKKKTKKKDKDDNRDIPSRLIDSFLDCLRIALSAPERVKDLNELIEVIEKLIKMKTADDILIPNLINWIIHFTHIKHKTYGELCSNVSSLKTFWLCAEKILSGKIDVVIIEDHVNYVADLLSRSRTESVTDKKQELEYNLLAILHILLGLQNSQPLDTKTKVPRQQLRTLPEKYRLKPNSEVLYFYCETCSINVCQACGSFMHANHDKNHVVKGSCNHETEQNNRPKQRSPEQEMEYLHRMELAMVGDPEKVLQLRKLEKERERRERERDRDNEVVRLREEALVNQKPVVQKDSDEEEKEEQLEIKSTSDKEIIESINKVSLDYSDPAFIQLADSCQGPANKISMAQLVPLLMKSIENEGRSKWGGKDTHFQGQGIDKFCFDTAAIQYTFEQVTSDRFLMFRVYGSRNGEDMDPERGMARRNMGPPRSIIVSNGRICVIMATHQGTNAVSFYNESKLRRCVKKRERARKHNDNNDNESNYTVQRKQNLPFEVLGMTFSQKNPSLLAVYSYNQLQVFQISEGRELKKNIFSSLNLQGQKITKITWLPQSSNRICMVLTKQVRLYELGDNVSRFNLRLLAKYVASRNIYDAIVRREQNTLDHCIFVCDNEGHIFYEKVVFDSQKAIQLTNKISLPHFEQAPVNHFSMLSGGQVIIICMNNTNLVMNISQGVIRKTMELKLSNIPNYKNDYGLAITNVKEIYSSSDSLIFACLIKKPQSTSGNLAVIELSGSNQVKIQCILSNPKAQSIDVMPYEDDKFMITSMQTDAYLHIWLYQVKTNKLSLKKEEPFNEQKMDEYNKMILQKHLLSYVGNGGNRCTDFNSYQKIAYTITQAGDKYILNNPNNAFITGIVVKIDAPGIVNLKVYDREYEINAKHPRELQIPFSLKETLLTFLNKSMTIEAKKKYNFDVYAIGFNTQSTYNEAYRKLVGMLKIDLNGRKDTEHYLNNSSRSDFMNISHDNLVKILKDARYEQTQINFILLVELMIQALDRNGMSLTSSQIEQFMLSMSKYLRVDKQYVRKSLKRLFKKLCWLYQIVNQNHGKSISQGDPFEYNTFMDLFWIEKRYREFLQFGNANSLDNLIKKLYKLHYKRLANLYLIFGLYPRLIFTICKHLRGELDSSYEGNRTKLTEKVAMTVRVICQHYQYNKNRGNTDSELQSFSLFQTLLGGVSKNRENFKEMILKAFGALQSLPILEEPISFSYGCPLLDISSVASQKRPYSMRMEEEGSQPAQEEKMEEELEEQMLPEGIIEVPKQALLPPPCIEPDNTDVSDIRKLIEQRGHSQVNILYYDFIYEMVLGLFRIDSKLRRQSSTFYVCLLFNFLNLLNVRINLYGTAQSKKMIAQWMLAIEKCIKNNENAGLFVVMAHFMEPSYNEVRRKDAAVDVYSESKRLKRHILRYYKEQSNPSAVFDLFLELKTINKTKHVKIKEALYQQFDTECPVYMLKYLGNLYINFLLQKVPINNLKVKEYILKAYVKYKIRVLKNILILERWETDLEIMKFAASLDDIQSGQVKSGFKRLLTNVQKKPQKFVEFIRLQPSLLEYLESLTTDKSISEYIPALVQILSKYYQAI